MAMDPGPKSTEDNLRLSGTSGKADISAPPYCFPVSKASLESSLATTAAISACSAFPRAVAVRLMAMSAFCNAISCDLLLAWTAASILSLVLLPLSRNRCFFRMLVTRTLFLYFPSSRNPSLIVVTPYPYFLLLYHSPSYLTPSDRSQIPKPQRLSFFHSPI